MQIKMVIRHQDTSTYRAVDKKAPNDSALCGQAPNDSALCGQAPNDSTLCGQAPNDSALCGQLLMTELSVVSS